MPEPIEKDTWVWVVVMDPEASPQYLGQEEDGTNTAYIPTFRSKEDAQQGVVRLSIEKSRKIEIQAVMFDHLCEDAEAGGFHLFVIDEDGAIVEKISPTDIK